ncbi:uncharacterized protein LOC118240957 isoform X2 [Electrophorus electricus]|uniref:uncharacterized protein LOC118240957 isoform X2 n=1 Tax=Electrophorus electricus TaxID=8005 RepID=UPI0015D0322E|nr:uncharacterized protein LOC118240957 isoform X2 [Electrophorus electricus]
MGKNTDMVVFQTRILHLGCCIIMFLPTYGDYMKSHKKSSFLTNITASQGENVVLSCNASRDNRGDIVWRKNDSLLYNQSPYKNLTKTNYTTSRMQVDPQSPWKLQISNVQPSDAGHYECFPFKQQWILSIEVRKNKPYSLKQMLLYIVPTVTGLIAVCLIIFCIVWNHSLGCSELCDGAEKITGCWLSTSKHLI